MEQLKYAPLIGQKLTRELLDGIIKELRAEIRAEVKRSKQPARNKPSKKPVELEDDGS